VRIWLCLALVACDRPLAKDNTVATASATAKAVASAAASGPTASATPSARAAAASPFAGTWSGDYDAKRAPVDLPKSTPWAAWKNDDGGRLGTGTVALRVDEGGYVDGETDGALGKLRLRGRIEDGALRAGVTPADPDDAPALSGALVGEAREGALTGTLRASAHDGELVRVATVTLRRK
jgi:hypothetical protein